MKTLTIDYELYRKENWQNRRSGFEDGVGEARRVFLELLAGAKLESLDVGDDEVLHKLAADLEPRVRRIRKGVG